MAGMNSTTACPTEPRFVQRPDIGTPIQIPLTRLEEVALILRVVIALSDELSDTDNCPTEADKARRFVVMSNNLKDVATFTKEVLADDEQ